MQFFLGIISGIIIAVTSGLLIRFFVKKYPNLFDKEPKIEEYDVAKDLNSILDNVDNLKNDYRLTTRDIRKDKDICLIRDFLFKKSDVHKDIDRIHNFISVRLDQEIFLIYREKDKNSEDYEEGWHWGARDGEVTKDVSKASSDFINLSTKKTIKNFLNIIRMLESK